MDSLYDASCRVYSKRGSAKLVLYALYSSAGRVKIAEVPDALLLRNVEKAPEQEA
jgi:hypothetical protein